MNAIAHKLKANLPVGRYEQTIKRVISTGIDEVDQILPNGGLQRGHLCQMAGKRGSGRTTFTLSLARKLASDGERTAIVDLEGDLDPSSFPAAGIPSELVWVVAPRDLEQGLWAVDVLVRSGHFGLVVLDGVESSIRTAALVRIQRWARETETVLLIGTNGRTLTAPGSLSLRFRALGVEWEEGLGMPSGLSRARFAIELSKHRSEALVRARCRRRTLLGRHALIADRRPARWTEQSGRKVKGGRRQEKRAKRHASRPPRALRSR